MEAVVRRIWRREEQVALASAEADIAGGDRPAPVPTLGLRVVNPSHVNATIDIVFLHGLTGGRESTWTARGAAACWPELFLPDDLPDARIIMYGYDADVVNFWSMASQNTVGDHSHKFLTSLANLRDETNTSRRSLAFVVHSLGGIVCQDALLRSRGSADQHTQRIWEHTRGIIFMGTPHCGSGLAEWAVIGSKFLRYFRQINQPTLEILQQRSEVMARIRQDFHTMLRGRDQHQEKDIIVVCFYEELPVRAVGEIVPKSSATLDRYTPIGIHANHMDMTKFSSDQDPDYRNVLSELRRLTPFGQSRAKEALPLTASKAAVPRQDASSADEHEQVHAHEDAHSKASTKIVNNFSGNFSTGGGKMIQGSEFSSGGGPMNF